MKTFNKSRTEGLEPDDEANVLAQLTSGSNEEEIIDMRVIIHSKLFDVVVPSFQHSTVSGFVNTSFFDYNTHDILRKLIHSNIENSFQTVIDETLTL